MASLKNRGKNRIGITNPFFPLHEKDVKEMVGKDAIYVDLKREDEWKMDWNQLETKLKEGLDALIISNPGNPCGNLLLEDDIKRLINLTNLHDCTLVLDEVYADFGSYFCEI